MNNINFLKVPKDQRILAEEAIMEVTDLLAKKSPKLDELFRKTTVTIGNNLIDSGARANAEKMVITLDAQKNSMSLQEAENFLVEQNILNRGDWTKVFFSQNTKPWSCLIYQLVHEFGHIVDGNTPGDQYHRIKVDLSPTKYGYINESEAFAEVFAYWIFGFNLDNDLERTIQDVVSKISFNKFT